MPKVFIGRTTTAAIFSGRERARLLGTSSPRRTEKKVVRRTTTPTASGPAMFRSAGTPAKLAASDSATVAPPTAPVSTPMSVMATWMADRKREGFSAVSRARR